MQHKAVAEQHLDIVTLLLEAGADPSAADAWQRTPLLEAFELGFIDIAQAICSKGARLTAGSRSFGMLMDAAVHDENKLRALVNNGGLDPNMLDGPDARTALHHACASKDRRAAERLVAVGANVNAADRCGFTKRDESNVHADCNKRNCTCMLGKCCIVNTNPIELLGPCCSFSPDACMALAEQHPHGCAHAGGVAHVSRTPLLACSRAWSACSWTLAPSCATLSSATFFWRLRAMQTLASSGCCLLVRLTLREATTTR